VTRRLARLTRRGVLKISLSVSGGLTLYGLLRFLARGEPPPTPRQFTLGYPEDYAVGTLTPIPEARALLLRDEAGFFALSTACTHLGCTLGTDASPLECPCHGSRFNQSGQVTQGPASQSLTPLELSLTSDGRILVNTGATVTPEARLSTS
jgi:nitrite reductase/ring-hydroxylating ferredoxin subunit